MKSNCRLKSNCEILPNKVLTVQMCDATGLNSSTKAPAHKNKNMKRRKFLQSGSAIAAGTFLYNKNLFAATNDFTSKRPPLSERKFTSETVETLITKVKAAIPDEQLSWLFENCFPNTLDTTVDFEMVNGAPDTYVITGDIDAMWLRDSSAQVNPYLPLIKEDKKLQQLIKGVINQSSFVIDGEQYLMGDFEFQGSPCCMAFIIASLRLVTWSFL